MHPSARVAWTRLSAGTAPNELWCTDFKGEFRLGDQRCCYPLTVTDHAARFILACEALESVKEAGVIPVFERLFRERGLPDAIRSDMHYDLGYIDLEHRTLQTIDNPFGLRLSPMS